MSKETITIKKETLFAIGLTAFLSLICIAQITTVFANMKTIRRQNVLDQLCFASIELSDGGPFYRSGTDDRIQFLTKCSD